MGKKCPNQTMPINVPRGVNTPCSEKCALTYFYGESKCTITNKKDNFGNYLEINCFDSPKNDVNFGLVGDLIIHSVKLFRPSLNVYNGDKADAEIILTHYGGGRNVYLCIPIVVNEKRGSSAKWFQQIIPFAPTFKQGTVSIGVSHFTLNHIIPKSSFVVYEGGVFCWGNGKDDVAIIYEKENAINMKSGNFSTLKTLITPHSYNTYPGQYLQYSSEGSRAGPGKKSGGGKSRELKCVPIYDQNGEKIPEGSSDIEPSIRGTGIPSSGQIGDKTMKWVRENTKLFIIIISVIMFMLLLGFGMAYFFKKRSAAASSATQGASGGSG